ncbi:MAG TPA: hypothetical protein VGQ18_01240 [Gemmatimonadales bacterium]|jgi:hypothetical protein|nr:hypothetical protein [Gemmatimonadales bacterium]
MQRFCWILLGGVVLGACGGGGGDGGPPTITSVVVSGDSTVVLAGSRQLTATALAGTTPISSGVTFQWFSSDTTRAIVTQVGLVVGVRLGNTGITALAVVNGTPTGVSSAAHAMRTRIGSIAIIPPSAPFFASLGDFTTLTAEARDGVNAAVPNITFSWTSRAPSVVSVTAQVGRSDLGDLTALQNGTARIVVSGDGVSDSITATVQQIATSLSITPDTTTFNRIGATLTPSVTATDARGNPIPASAIGWNSLNTAAATVNATSGVITSVNEGQSLVIGTSGSVKDTIHVGVALVYKSVDIATTGGLPAPIDSGVINRLNGTLQLGLIVRDSGNTVVPSPQGITWSLKTGTIASIGAGTGLITGNTNTGRDTVVLVARTVRDSVPLVVKQVLATIAVTPASPAALNFVGDTQTFAAEPRDSGGAAIPGQTITWATNNAVLGINAAGLATAIARTSATGITVKVRAATGGLTDSSRSIVVRQIPASADLDPNSFDPIATLGRQVSASCVVLDSASDTIPNHLCTWSALTPGVVSFNPTTAKTTTITAVGNGTTTVRAQAATSLFGFNSVTVDQVAASVALLPANLGTPDVQMKINQNAPFYAVVRDSANNIDARARTDVTWSVSPGTSASVSASTSGTVTVTTNGTAGSDTVQATIGAVSGQRVVAVVASGVSFAASVQTVFNNNCTICHSGASPPEGMSLAAGVAIANIVDVASGEVPALKRVRPFRPDSSYLVHKIQGTQATVGGSGSRMPLGQTPLSNTTINIIRNWILQGAPDN